MKSMFNTILQLPLFQGISTRKLTTILDKAVLHFEKKAPGEMIAESGQVCDSLIFILQGNVEKVTQNHERSTYKVSEHLPAPYLIEPSSMFGMHTVYRSTYTTLTTVDIMTIGKDTVKDILLKDDVFRINYLNIVCRHSQQMEQKIWDLANYSHSMVEGGLEEMS